MRQKAFSLVELSIVLVILGLLVGGVLAGQSLIRASELRSVGTEFSRYQTAAHAFRDKYFAVPGDMTNATNFWGQSANCPGSSTQGTTDGTTCNGNGNGQIYFVGSHLSPTANEVHRFWQHLTSAGMIEGSYNGVTTSPTGYYLGIGPTNSPKSKADLGFWSAFYLPNATGGNNGAMFHYNIGPHVFLLAAINGTSWNSTPILKADEAWNIDTKLDDAKPGRGIITGRVGSSCSDAATGADYDASYVLTSPNKNCFLVFNPY